LKKDLEQFSKLVAKIQISGMLFVVNV